MPTSEDNLDDLGRPRRRRRRLPRTSATPVAAEPVRRRRRRGRDRAAIPRPEFEWVDIETPRPYDNNPRINEHVVPLVRRSIEEFGFLVPLVVDVDDVIIAGHTRMLAALEIGYTEVPIVRAEHLTPEQVQAFRIIDNKLAELADWNRDALAVEVQQVMTTGLDLTDYGFQQTEIDCLSDMVSDDCLSAGVTDQTSNVTQGEQETGTRQTRFVIGEFVVFVDTEEYQRWSQGLYQQHNYERVEILADLCDRLGVENARA